MTLFDTDAPPPPLPGSTPHRAAHARRTDPVTSADAAASITAASMRDSQRAVMARFQHAAPFGGMTLEQLVDDYTAAHNAWPQMYPRQSDSGLRTRVSELVDAGWLADTGNVRPTRSGRRAIVWSTVRTRPPIDPPGDD